MNIRSILPVDFPTIICLCGSTRFYKTFEDMCIKLTLEGKIVLSLGTHSADSQLFANPQSEETKIIKRKLDKLHFRKIELADEILVINVGGYIGESTRNEIKHARSLGKTIRYLRESI